MNEEAREPTPDLRSDPDVPGGIRYDPDLAVHEPAVAPGEPPPPSRRRSPLLLFPIGLGGLAVAEDSGEVLRADGSRIAGLYAVGRSAVGLCSRSYVSGLSLADCVYSGRRAGRHAATRTASSPRNSAPQSR